MKKITIIEDLLSEALLNLGTEKYMELIKGNKNLLEYDNILGKVDNGDYPESYMEQFTDEVLDDIIKYLNDKKESR